MEIENNFNFNYIIFSQQACYKKRNNKMWWRDKGSFRDINNYIYFKYIIMLYTKPYGYYTRKYKFHKSQAGTLINSLLLFLITISYNLQLQFKFYSTI